MSKERLARKEVEYAVAAGRLVKGPCCACGGDARDAHHVDYDHPLAVMWLCRGCHLRLHNGNWPKREAVEIVRSFRRGKPARPAKAPAQPVRPAWKAEIARRIKNRRGPGKNPLSTAGNANDNNHLSNQPDPKQWRRRESNMGPQATEPTHILP